MKMKTVTNHPVHIVDDRGDLTKSALIPFCEFGGNMSVMGTKIDQFDVPVCNSFKAKVLNDQLCYEVDPKKFIDPKDVHGALQSGLTMLVDINEDREVLLNKSSKADVTDKLNSKLHNQKGSYGIMIYLNTIEPLRLSGEGSYDIEAVKAIETTSSFYDLSEETRGCQNYEPYEDCTTRLYQTEALEECGCLPGTIRSDNKVQKSYKIFHNKTINPLYAINRQLNVHKTK